MNEEKRNVVKGVTVVGLLVSLIGMFFTAVLVGLIINSIYWAYSGYDKTINSLNNIYVTQVEGISVSHSTFSHYYLKGLSKVYHWSNVGQGMAFDAIEHSVNTLTSDRGISFDKAKFHEKLVTAETYLQKSKNIFLMTFNVIAAKFLGILSSSFVILFAVMLGVLDGLLNRYIRTREGGRESSFLYHRAAVWMVRIPFFIIVLYLSIPIEINTELVILGVGLLAFMLTFNYAKTIKKFL
tara:strand:- start:4040 stop:4756 length:717 start_codon:yes stop_codon:yes gene_type:complete